MTKCSICKTEESKHWLGCLGGWTLCSDCAKDYDDFDNQVDKNQNIVILMEVYFRRGQGEKISFEQLYKEKSDYKFLTFEDLYKLNSGGKTNGNKK